MSVYIWIYEVYPYEYIGSFKKLFDEQLPGACELFISLKDECISEKDYIHAIDIWIMFKMKTMGDYHDLHLNTDIYY